MEINKATKKDIDTVVEICRRGISECFAKYYPQQATEFFYYNHGKERVTEDIGKGITYLIYNEDNEPVGTISVDGNEIYRFFICQEQQGKGYGKRTMDYFEEKILKDYDEVRLDAALSAFNMYLKRGYKMIKFIPYPKDNGEYLCYFEMSKRAEE